MFKWKNITLNENGAAGVLQEYPNTLYLEVHSRVAITQWKEISAAIPIDVSVLHFRLVFDVSNEADFITTFPAIKTRLAVVMLPLSM